MDQFNFGGSELTRGHMLQMLLRISVASVITYYSVKWMMNQIDPTSKNKKKAKLLAEEQLKRFISIHPLLLLTEIDLILYTYFQTRKRREFQHKYSNLY